MKKEDFQNTKIRVRNEAESKEFQEAMFKLGFRWGKYGYTTRFPKSLFLFVGYNCITFGETEAHFNNHKHKEITIESIRNNMKAELTKEVAEKMYKSDDESVRAFALSNYPDLEVKALPKTWEELGSVKGACIDVNSRIVHASHYILGEHASHYILSVGADSFNKNVYPTRELAEAALALAQLLQLRDRYNGDWKPDWNQYSQTYTICVHETRVSPAFNISAQRVMHFKTEELRDQFLENFRDLLEIAKPLL